MYWRKMVFGKNWLGVSSLVRKELGNFKLISMDGFGYFFNLIVIYYVKCICIIFRKKDFNEVYKLIFFCFCSNKSYIIMIYNRDFGFILYFKKKKYFLKSFLK